MGCNGPFLQTNYKINANQVQDPCNSMNQINATFKPLLPITDKTMQFTYFF